MTTGAALLLNALEDNGLEPGTVAALHKSWGI